MDVGILERKILFQPFRQEGSVFPAGGEGGHYLQNDVNYGVDESCISEFKCVDVNQEAPYLVAETGDFSKEQTADKQESK